MLHPKMQNHRLEKHFNLLRLYFDNLPVPVSVLDDSGNYLYCNISFYETFLKQEYNPFFLLGKRNSDLFSTQVANNLDSNNYLAMKLGGTQCFEEYIEFESNEFDYWLSLKKPVFTTDGEAKLLISAFLNITERKKNENKLGLGIFDENNQPFLNYVYGNEALSYLDQGSRLIPKNITKLLKKSSLLNLLKNIDFNSENSINIMAELLEITLLNFPGNVYVRDDQSNVKFININLASVIGIDSAQNAFGKSMYDLLPIDVADTLVAEDKKILSSKDVHFMLEPVILHGNEQFYMSYKRSMKNPFESGHLFIGISVDYTLQKQLELNIEKAINSQSLNQKTMESFVTNISHDIRTPITGMLGLISEIKSQVDHYPDLYNKLNTLDTLTNEFLSFFNGILQSVENNDGVHVSENNEPINLEALVKSCIALFKPSLMYQDVYLTTLIPNNIPKYLIGNERMIKQIIINLIGNAVKFSESGEIKVILTYQTKLEKLQIVVSDHGIGINQCDHDRIFERFTRLDLSPNSRYSGSGLGLYIVKKYVDLLKGNVKVKSRLGKGSAFTVTLSMPKAGDSIGTEINGNELNQPIVLLNNLRVLVVEDNKLACLALKNSIVSLGLSVDVATTGKDALNLIRNTNYDYIFLDLGLPDQSGLDVLLKLRNNSNCKDIPIFVLSGHVTKQMYETCCSIGATGVYMKPMLQNQVKEVLNLNNVFKG
ncbi:MAG: ATP-binding protein [Gammaproteobacteria bacterium]|nr:ATP-binding protein [Gammaproteobacteria bacterium]